MIVPLSVVLSVQVAHHTFPVESRCSTYCLISLYYSILLNMSWNYKIHMNSLTVLLIWWLSTQVTWNSGEICEHDGRWVSWCSSVAAFPKTTGVNGKCFYCSKKYHKITPNIMLQHNSGVPKPDDCTVGPEVQCLPHHLDFLYLFYTVTSIAGVASIFTWHTCRKTVAGCAYVCISWWNQKMDSS